MLPTIPLGATNVHYENLIRKLRQYKDTVASQKNRQ